MITMSDTSWARDAKIAPAGDMVEIFLDGFNTDEFMYEDIQIYGIKMKVMFMLLVSQAV